MVKPIDRPNSPDFTPPIPEDPGYSKLLVTGLFLATIPIFVAWAALIVLCLPIKCWNWLQQLRGKEQVHAINAFIREFFDLCILSARYPFSKKYHYTPGNGKPILLVHGYLHNASGWHTMIKRLENEQLGPIYAVDLGDGSIGGNFLSIKENAKKLLKKTEEIAQQTGRKDISIVAHSMGGLVSAAYAKLAPKDAQVDIITLGSPLNGSPLANRFATGPNGRAMICGSEFIKDLRKGMENNEDHIHFRHIAAKHDLMVPVESALFGTNPADNVTIDDIGHSGLFTSERVADQVCKWLTSPEGKSTADQKA